MYKYPLTTSQKARDNLDRKAANDGYEDANADYPNILLPNDVREQGNNHVDAALDMNDHTTDDHEEYRARYTGAYCKAYAEQIASRQEDEEHRPPGDDHESIEGWIQEQDDAEYRQAAGEE